jgi:hypothetical protein
MQKEKEKDNSFSLSFSFSRINLGGLEPKFVRGEYEPVR